VPDPYATLITAATAFVFDVLWKEPEEDQAVAAPRPNDTPSELHQLVDGSTSRLKIKLRA
jgi:hypothetical protein